MRFLAPPECAAFATQVGLDHRKPSARKRIDTLKNAADFFYKSRMKDAHAVAVPLARSLGEFTWALLWAYSLPWGDRSHEDNAPVDWRRYAHWRQSVGDERTLYEAPGHLFEPDEQSKLAEVIEFAIYTGWDAVVFARPLRCVMALSHDDVIKIQSRHNLSPLAEELRRLGLSQKDFYAR
jgi:hypothetical protein